MLKTQRPCALAVGLSLFLILTVAGTASGQADAGCRFPAELAGPLLQGSLDRGDLPLEAQFLVDEAILLDEGRVQATVEGRLEAGPLNRRADATLCVFLLLNVDGEPIMNHSKRLDIDDFGTFASLRYVLRADLPEGTRQMVFVAVEEKSGLWGAVAMEEPGGSISGPSFTATRVAEYEGAYYEVSRRAAAAGGGGSTVAGRDLGSPPAGGAPSADRPRAGASGSRGGPADTGGDVELFPRSVQAPRLGSRRPAPQVEKLAGEQILRLVPPRRQPASGPTFFHVLTSTVAVERVAIEVDGVKVAEDKRPPFRLRVPLAKPATIQTVRAIGYDGLGVPMAEDEVRINLVDAPFRVRITDFDGDPNAGQVTLEGLVTVPADATLDRLEVWYNEELVETVRERSIRLDLQTPDVSPTDYLRLAAYLSDGSSIDDVLLLAAPEVEEVDVNLVELHAVVTGRGGQTVSDLPRDAFEILYRGRPQETASFAYADDVPLVLGLLVDTSGSMELLMHDTRRAAAKFIGQTILPRDQAFVVDFDEQPRLLHDVSGDVVSLMRGLNRLEAAGKTAMYDAIVFSLLQFENQGGRRALVVLSDGDDLDSRFGPKQCIDMARDAGVPVYVIGLGALDTLRRSLPKRELRQITEETGGNLFFVDTFEQLAEAYAQINAELRSQYSLGFYAQDDLTDDDKRKVEVKVRGKGLEARTVVGVGGATPQ
ncbi:MAG: VWA domain-containing protein [Acidobacteriota bacterium]